MNCHKQWRCVVVFLVLLAGCKSEPAGLSEEVNAKNECFESFEMAVREGRVNDMKNALSEKSIVAWEQEFQRQGAGIRDWDAFLESRRSSLAALLVDDVVLDGNKATVINTLGSRYSCVKEGGAWKREIEVVRVESIPPEKKARQDCFEPFFASIAEGDIWGVKGNLTTETREIWEKSFQTEGAEMRSWEDWVKRYATRLPSTEGVTAVASDQEATFTLPTGFVYTCVLQNDSWLMVLPLDAFPPELPPPAPPEVVPSASEESVIDSPVVPASVEPKEKAPGASALPPEGKE